MEKNTEDRQEKVGVYFSGGGMNGAYAVGVMKALKDKFNFDRPDLVLGSSAGSANGAYYAAGQIEDAAAIWLEDVAGNDFICQIPGYGQHVDVSMIKLMPLYAGMIGEEISEADCARLAHSKINVDYLIDLFKKNKPLKVSELIRRQVDLVYVTTDLATAEPFYIRAAELEEPLDGIRASMAIPHFYNQTVHLLDRELVDGDLSASHVQNITELANRGARKIMAVVNEDRMMAGVVYSAAKKTGRKDVRKCFQNKLKGEQQIHSEIGGAKVVVLSPGQEILPTSTMINQREAVLKTMDMAYQQTINNVALEELMKA